MTVTASDISTPLEQLANRTAALVTDVQEFTSSGSWTKPALALWYRIVLVGGGAGGTGGGTEGTTENDGGAGGNSGGIRYVEGPASDLPSSLTVTIGAGGAGSAIYDVAATDGGDTTIAGTGVNLVAEGGDASATRIPDAAVTGGYQGGQGGDAADGYDGAEGYLGTVAGGTTTSSHTGTGGYGGANGSASTYAEGGGGGTGYGSGGGGGGAGHTAGTQSATYGGGGGGSNGYGTAVTATDGADADGSGNGAGGAGADGYVVITTWRGVAVT